MTRPQDDTGREVYALLAEAKRYGIGILIEPDLDAEGEDNGWTIGYMIHEWPAAQGLGEDYPGDRLSSAYDLETGVAAAMKPLKEIGDQYHRYLASGS